MVSYVTKCDSCHYMRVIRGDHRGVMDCDPDELICEYEMNENFGTEGGCYRYEEYDDYYED